MKEYTFRRQAPYDCKKLFDMAADVEEYPEFVPGYTRVTVRHREANSLDVTQTVSIMGRKMTFDSVATLDAPRSITITAQPAGLRQLDVIWRFHATGTETTEIALTIRYESRNAIMDGILRHWVRLSGERQVQAFLERAHALYGGFDARGGRRHPEAGG